MNLDNINGEINTLVENFEYIKQCLNLEEKSKKLGELIEIRDRTDFWSNADFAMKTTKIIKNLENLFKKITNLQENIKNLISLVENFNENEDAEIIELILSELSKLKDEVDELKVQTLLNEKFDNNNAIITIHSGAGGTESQDWVVMLFRMYNMFCNSEGFDVLTTDSLDTGDAGLKYITFIVKGENAYGKLKGEMGVHRLVRISPFDSNNRRHTTFASVEVIPEVENENIVKISSDDLKIDTFRSSGAGGQNVNKVDSAIRITHLPTGIVVTCQNERSQLQNKETALKILQSKLTSLEEEKRKKDMNEVKGELKKIEWGSQIRSYIFQPYTMVKDHRTNFETADVQSVMNGNLSPFINEYLKKSHTNNKN